MLVLQPTSFCNIDCDYCILPGRSLKNLMADETLKAVVSNLAHDQLFSPRLTILWHSGEPLAAGIDFYRRAFDIVSYHMPRKVEVRHSILTNGTLIDEKWAEWFLDNGVRIGVSCDGPAFLHDSRRKTRSGKGTHEKVMRGIRVLQEHGIDFYILSVLSAASLKCAAEILQFAKQNNVKAICFNIEETEGINASSTLAADQIESYVEGFFQELLRHSFESGDGPWIRELDEMIPRFFRNDTGDLENHLTQPFKIITVDVNGGWTTFSPELAAQNFCFGNLSESPISQHLAGSAFQNVNRQILAGIEKCRNECEYFAVCGGGAPSNKYAELGSFDVSETKYCRTMIKAVASVCMAGLGQFVLREPLAEGSRPTPPGERIEVV
jgi:uncharacterized protein